MYTVTFCKIKQKKHKILFENNQVKIENKNRNKSIIVLENLNEDLNLYLILENEIIRSYDAELLTAF